VGSGQKKVLEKVCEEVVGEYIDCEGHFVSIGRLDEGIHEDTGVVDDAVEVRGERSDLLGHSTNILEAAEISKDGLDLIMAEVRKRADGGEGGGEAVLVPAVENDGVSEDGELLGSVETDAVG